MTLPEDKNKAFEDGVLTRADGYNMYFNPFQNRKNPLYQHWLKGWLNQHNLMIST